MLRTRAAMILNNRAVFLAAALALASVVPAWAGDLHGFAWSTKGDLFGYYLPSTYDSANSCWTISQLATLRRSADFAAGRLMGKPYAPVMFSFNDTASPKVHGETGDSYKNAP